MTFKNIFKTLFFIYFQTVNQMNKGLDRTDLLLNEDRPVANDFQKHFKTFFFLFFKQ